MDEENESGILNTALALQALKAANYSDTTILYQAINFLITNQHLDGGWGFTSNDPSNAYVTAIVLRALSGYSSQFSVQSSIQSASAYLLTKQNTDGGFGSSPSNVYETALAIDALVAAKSTAMPALTDGINYLTTTQLPNGSWNDDPYSTALALQALANVRPNLQLSSISLSIAMPREGEDVTITALVANNGLEDAANVVVRFYAGDPSTGGVQIGTDQVIQLVARGSSAQASITQSFTGNGAKTIFAVVDPDNQISETLESDNRASARLWVATGPDLAVFSEDLKPSTYVPATGAAFTFEYTIRNLGETEAGQFSVALYDGDPSTGGAQLQTAPLSGVPGSGSRTGTFGVTLSTDGPHTLYLVADAFSEIIEISETNNKASATVTVGGVQTGADLAVTPMDIAFTPGRPAAGEAVQISGRVRNQGTDSAFGFLVELYDGPPESGGALIQSQTLSLSAGSDQVITATWTPAPGIHDIQVIVDRENKIAETNETNNRAAARLMPDMVDISISATDLVFTPSRPVANDSVALTITVRNSGIMNTGAFTLGLYNGDPNAGGTLLQNFPIANIAGDGSQTVVYTFIAQPQTYRFYAVADTENVVTEMYEENNQAIRSLTIKSIGETYGPDLVPVKIDLSGTMTDPQTLAVSGNALVTFQNKGDDKITSSFNVTVFEDKDSDGKYTQGVDTTLGMSTFVTGPTASIPAIWPEGAGMVSVPLSGTVKFLHSPLYALVDSGDAILEQDETNNLLISCKDCENRPATTIKPKLKWKWRNGQSQSTLDNVRTPPVVAQIKDDNNDGKIDSLDDPYLLFITRSNLSCQYCSLGRLHAVNGRTGVELASYSDPLVNYFSFYAHIAIADIDADGAPEIVVPGGSVNGGGILCFRYDNASNQFKLVWNNYSIVQNWVKSDPIHRNGSIYDSAVPVIADIDADGAPEIIVGKIAIANDGSIKWAPRYGGDYDTNGNGSLGQGIIQSAEVADIDMDGIQEVIAGNIVYDALGGIKWANLSVPDGITAIGNFDDDPHPNIVLVSNFGVSSKVYRLDYQGNIQWGPIDILKTEQVNTHAMTSPPIIADFDGDGKMDIGVKGYHKFLVLDSYDGHLKQSYYSGSGTPDTGGPVAATVFDLDGDGRPEVLLHITKYFRIYDGKEGTLLYEELFGGLSSNYQNVIVADVDGDGHSEIVVVGGDNQMYTTAYQAGANIYGFDPSSAPWVGARKIWNQDGYHVTNVNDDGSIPQHEAPSWLLNNTYRTQASVGTSTNPYLTPNLTASYLRAARNGTGYDLTVRIGNGGMVEAPEGMTVAFSDGDPAAGGAIIGTASTTRVLMPGEYQDITLSVASLADGQHALYATVDGGPDFKECNATDNQARLDLTILSGLPDLKVGSEDLSVPNTTVTEGNIISLTVNVKNVGLANASDVTVKLSNGNPSTSSGQVPGGTWMGLPQTVGSISAGGTAALTFTFDTLGKAGQNILYVTVDPDNTVIEATKANNVASIVINVQPPQLPNLVIGGSNIQITPVSPREGELVSVSAVVTNRGAEVGNIPVQFTLGDPSAGGTLISEQTIYPMLGLGQSATVNAFLNTIGLAGQREFYVTIDPAGTITESSRTDNTASKALFIQSAGLSAVVTLDKPEYQQNEAVTATITANNTTANVRTVLLTIQVKDSAGAVIAAVSQAEPVTINPSETVALTRTWNTGSTLAGGYAMAIELAEAGLTIARGTADFSIAPDKRIDARVTTNKIAYYPNETAELAAVVASGSANFVFEDLTATITVLSADGQQTAIKTDTRTIKGLMPGAAYTFKSYWNAGTNPPGDYPVDLLVTNSTGSVVASGSRTLTITNDLKPSALLSGRVTLDRQSVMSNEPVSVTYTVSNIGNVDLSNVALSLRTVHVKNQTIYGSLTETASLPLATSVTTTSQIDTTSYSAMDYLIVLQAAINGGAEETLAGSYFRVEGAPTVPALSAPENGSDVETLTPTLTVNNASDPNDDRLTYEFELYADSGLTSFVAAAGGIAQGLGTTSWQVPAELTENSTYYWRSRAYDGKLYSEWMLPVDSTQGEPASFRVNVANDPPTAPTIASPPDNTEVPTRTPVLTVNNASDPDSTNLTYNFQVSLDPDCAPIVPPTVGIPGGTGTTSWQVDPPLSDNTWYYWCAQADDWLDVGPWSVTAKFFVNTTNDKPTVPVILSPVNDATVTNQNVDIVLENSTDIDSPVISYYFEVDTVPTFDSASIIRSGIIPPGPGTTTWQAIGLMDNTEYYVRAMSSDGSAGSDWSNQRSFFVNTANDAPTTPTIANPSNGAGVNVDTPTLAVHNATDIDRDALIYEFAVYNDAAFTDLVDSASGIAENAGTTSWTVTVALTENQKYYWRARAYDGSLNSGWAEGWFVVNKANDAPEAPKLLSPADGSTVDTLTPTFTVVNAKDPDSDTLTYTFEVYNGSTLVWSKAGVSEGTAGNTSVTISTALSNITEYQWQCRASDGDREGPWTAKARFTVHMPQTGITADIRIEPETLNQKSKGNWVMAEIALPHGYKTSDVDISSIRLEGTVPAAAWPYEQKKRHLAKGCVADPGAHDHGAVKVKFSRSAVIAVLPQGDHVPVHVTGMVGATTFEGVDIIRVIH